MKYIALFLIYPIGLFAQTTENLSKNGFENKAIDRIEYSNKKNNFFISKSFRKDIKTLYLNFQGEDSVSIYLNDSLIFSRRIFNTGKWSFEPSRTISIPFSKKNKDTIIISLNDKKQYVIFNVKKKYYSIWTYYTYEDNNWVVGQDNNLPWE